MSTDPLQEKYPGISTYAYCFLNPLKYIDPTGMAPWEPLESGNLRAQKGDDFETLQTYLTEIHGEKTITEGEWNELETQVNELKSNSIGGDISGNQISSSTGLFKNLVGIYLVTRALKDASWGYPWSLEGLGNLCSPTTFNRVDKAMEFVHGRDVLGKLSGSNTIYARWNAFPSASGTKYGEEMLPEMGYGIQINGLGILDGQLEPGAVSRMTQTPGPGNKGVSWHSVIFMNYTYDDDCNINGITYWQQKASSTGHYIGNLSFDYNNEGKYNFSKGYKPKLGSNFK